MSESMGSYKLAIVSRGQQLDCSWWFGMWWGCSLWGFSKGRLHRVGYMIGRAELLRLEEGCLELAKGQL